MWLVSGVCIVTPHTVYFSHLYLGANRGRGGGQGVRETSHGASLREHKHTVLRSYLPHSAHGTTETPHYSIYVCSSPLHIAIYVISPAQTPPIFEEKFNVTLGRFVHVLKG